MKDQAAEEKRSADNIQECHEFIEVERWHEAAECFQNILQRDSTNAEARRGFRQARCGEEAAFYFQLAAVSLAQNRLDDAFDLLTVVSECEREHKITITGSQEMLKEVVILRDLRDKRKELRKAKLQEDWQKAIYLLHEIIKLDPEDKQAGTELQKAIQEHRLQELYHKLVQDIEDEDWISAEQKIKQVENSCLNYKDIPNLKEKVEKNKRWRAWYSDIKKDMIAGRWDDAIETCHKIIREAERYKNVYQLLEEAERAKKVKTDYQQAVLNFEDGQLDEALSLLQSILGQDPDHEEAKRLREQVQKVIDGKKILNGIPVLLEGTDPTTIHEQLESVGRLFEDLKEDHPTYNTYCTIREKWQIHWDEEVAQSKKHIDNLIKHEQWKQARNELNKLVIKKFIKETDEYYASNSVKIKAGLKRERVETISIIVGIVGIVLTILTLDYVGILNRVERIEQPSPTATLIISNIDRIEVLMDGGQLNLDQLPSLTHGEAVVLEVIVFDTDGKRYISDDLICKWSVAPLGDKDVDINTDRCKTLYIPSQEYSSQTVRFEVEGLEQQFKPGSPISMKFDIAE